MLHLPLIKVEISNLTYNIHSISGILYDSFSERNKSLPFKERVFHIFPQLSETIKDGMTNDDIHEVVKMILHKEYQEHIDEMEKRRVELSEKLDELQKIIIPKMLQLFEVDWPEEQKYITCYLGLYTVFPRNVLTKEYWIHYKVLDDVFMRASLHEINHFILFEKWKAIHGYEYDIEPEHPDVLWFLEEMAVDPTLNTPLMQEVAPYPQKAYKSFYDNKLQGMPIENHIIKFFQERKNMADFLDSAYRFISDNHRELIDKCG